MLMRGDMQGAMAQVDEVLKKDQHDRQALLLRARVGSLRGQSNDLQDAVQDLKEVLVQEPNSRRLIKAVDAMPPGPPPPGMTGPPPEIAAITKRLQLGGMFLSLMIITIAVLMMWRPGCVRFGVHGC